MPLQKIKRGSHFDILTGIWIFHNITLHRDTSSWKPQAKIRLAFHFVERNNDRCVSYWSSTGPVLPLAGGSVAEWWGRHAGYVPFWPLPALHVAREFNQIWMQGPFLEVLSLTWKKLLPDTVDHSILIHKLEFYGFRGVTNVWFRSYLQDRTQVTVIDQRPSNKSVVTYGVP